MSKISRRRFLKASAASVGAAGVIEGCGEGAAPPTGTMPPTSPPPGNTEPNNPPPATTTPPVTTTPPTQPPPTTTQPPPAMAMVPRRPLGVTGLDISVIGFGGGSRFLMASDAEAEKMLARAIELGLNYFDTAFSYGGNQESQKRYGRFLTPAHRDKIVLTSKINQRTADAAQRQLDQTLTNLKTDHLDILHFHELGSTGEVSTIVGPNGALGVYQKAKEQGIIKFIGCSGHVSGAIMLDALRRIKPDVVMCPQNAAHELGFTDMVIPYAQQNKIGIMGMKITAQDALMRNGVTAEDLVRYSLSLPVASMIVGMRSMAVLESCASVARTFKQLTAAEMQGISGKLASLHLPSCLPYKRHGYRDGGCIG